MSSAATIQGGAKQRDKKAGMKIWSAALHFTRPVRIIFRMLYESLNSVLKSIENFASISRKALEEGLKKGWWSCRVYCE